MDRGLIAIAMAVLVAGCGLIAADQAKRGLDSYIGKPLSNVALKFGPPKLHFDGGNERTAFQWEHYGVDQSPGMANRIGNTVVYTAPQTSTTECRLSILAVPAQPNANPDVVADWYVESWSYHGNGCV